MDSQRGLRWLSTAALLLFVFLAISFGRLALFAFTPAQSGSQSSAIIEVHKGEGPQEISALLAKDGAVIDTHRFISLGRMTRQWKHIKAGEYRVSPAMTPIEIFSIITSGISVPHPVTVREGENMYEIASDIEAKGLATAEDVVTLCKSASFRESLGLPRTIPTLEGFLFPDTYFFNRTMKPADMIRQMVHHFKVIWSPAEEKRAAELGMTEAQLITLASIVEKETGAPGERPLIASIFFNRLRKHMKLQSDPTTIYGMWDRYDGNIRLRDLHIPSPYNTYTLPALPVGPISNPGKDAIHAVLFPAQSDYLYFVSHNDGTHQFSRTLAEHNAAVRKFQVDPKARAGKSWRDLKKQH